jgi:hypothetical protein
MTAPFLILSITFILLGAAFLIYPRQIDSAFCKAARWSWKKATFGLTDMRWFHREGSPNIFRAIGAFFALAGLAFLIFISISFVGPGSLFAMREAAAYLKQKYPSDGELSISAKKQNPNATLVHIRYRHGTRSGTLTAEWDGAHYQFKENE